MSFEPTPHDPWSGLRQFTAARIALGRTGGSAPTGAQLGFALDHALARDAVHAPFDAEALAEEFRQRSGFPEILTLTTAAPDRATYLQRPDLGRKLSEDSASQLSTSRPEPARGEHVEPVERLRSQLASDLAIIVSDGLSALAAHRQAPPLLAALLPRLNAAGFSLAPLCIVRHARVALIDEIGSLLRARLALILLGERPGLGTPDSLGAYLVFDPRTGRTNADRNCISNIRPAGLPPEVAAEKIAALLIAARTQCLSGVALKEVDPPLPQAGTSSRIGS